MPDIPTPKGFNVSPDYPALFSTTAPWPTGLSRVRTFILLRRYIQAVPDSVLQPKLLFLKQLGIRVGVAMGVVLGNGCGQGVEGMVFGPNVNRGIAERIKRLGGTLDYIIADEPYTFGHKSRKINACQYTVQQVAASFAQQVASILTVFPNAQVVDNEASSFLKDTVDATLWLDTLKAALGPNVHPVFGLDVQWEKKFWFTWAQPFVDLLALHGYPYSIVYHGIGHYKVDSQWLAMAAAFARNWEATVTTPPLYIVLQSWNPAPSHVLPETDPTALTSLVVTYCGSITKYPKACARVR